MSDSAAPSQIAGATSLTPKEQWQVLACVVFGLFMVILDQTVVNVAFPTIQRQFTADVSAVSWILSLYTMTLGIAMPLSGFLADRFGHKQVFLSALGLFVTGSLLCALSPSLWMLIVARAVQGVGGGIALPIGTAMLFAAFPSHERGKAMGVFGIAMVVAPALGPILGGWLVDAAHWRWIFLINVPIGVVGVLLGLRWLKAEIRRRAVPFDPVGVLFSSIGFGAALYAASIAADKGWAAMAVLIWFAVGAVSLTIFAVVELKRSKEPLLDLRLFQSGVFTAAALTGYVSVVALFGAEFLMPLYLQLMRSRTALEAGILLLPMAIAAAIVTPFSGRLFDRIGARPLAVLGFSILAVNTWQLSKLTAGTTIHWIQFLLFIRGIALGLTVQTTVLVSLSAVPLHMTARASALINSTRQVVQAVGVAVLATILSAAVAPDLTAALAQYQTHAPIVQQLPDGSRWELCNLPPFGALAADGGSPVMLGAPPRMPPQALGMIHQFCGQSIAGLARDYRVTFYASLLAVVLGAMLPGWPGKWTARRGAPGES
ncbi:MAG: DHA2 family efflux MFS transporter permease subunit [Mycobacterium leprae]